MIRKIQNLIFILLAVVISSSFFASYTFANAINIETAQLSEQSILIKGTTSIPPETSNYIQYYIGKMYEGTISCCIYCDGFNTDDEGKFSLEIPISNLRGEGRYEIVLEQNPRTNSILPPKHWVAFRKVDGKIEFGDITSMGEISNLALTVGMEIDKVEVVVGEEFPSVPQIEISSVNHVGGQVIVKGNSKIDRSKSTYIQYYVGKQYPNTLSNCILAHGFHVSADGSFEFKIPVSSLKGSGTYEIALEQNPGTNTILAPKHWVAFRKTEEGIIFGDISSMGEISNLALTVGMELARTTFSID